MKAIFTLLIILGLAASTTAQSTRMVLIEEATNASCGPCASQNPAFDALLNANRDILTAIKYHWYFPGYDPMHNHNVAENNARVSYYGINGVPTAAIDGDIPSGAGFSYPGGPHGYTQALIDQYAAVPSPFNINMSHNIIDDVIHIDMMIEATQDVSGDLVAHMVVVEKEINFTSAPGSNGETTFLDVMKKMIPNDDGTDLPASFEAGDYMIIQGSWELANIYDMSELGVVGFIQNDANKTVHQAANSIDEPLMPIYSDEATVTMIDNVAETNCMGTVAPHITIRNNGAATLTTVEVKYHVNGEELQSYTWNGNLTFLETDMIELPGIEFSVLEENELVIYTEYPNGNADEYAKNDTIKQSFEQSVVAPVTINLMIKTDDNPEETTWDIVNSNGEVILSGGPYSDPQTIHQEELDLPYYDCFLFHIYDAGGDGLLIPGFYALYFDGSTYIASGTTFGEADSAYFEGYTAVGVPEVNSNLDVMVYPNPFSNSAKVAFMLEQADQVKYSIFNILGEQISVSDQGLMSAGPQEITIQGENLNTGIYFLQLNIGNKMYTERITISK